MKNYDVIIVGGSYSGMAAALQLLRARRSVLVIDGGKRRNRAASHSHGFLAQDGVDPAVIAATARGSVTFFTNGVLELDESALQDLSARDVAVEATRIERIEGHADVVLADGRRLSFAGLFTAPKNAPSTPIAEHIGCTIADTPMGTQIHTNEAKETNIAGVFACGDAARVPHSVSLAVADGAWAGAQIHRSLVWPES